MSVSSTVNNIGVPLQTVSCFVIEPAGDVCGPQHFKLLPQGEIGELAVGGHQLARGYINREEQTAAAFIDSPYGLVYRTGDKARLLSDGTLECLGRLSDGQVKLRGQRLELGEVEQALMRATGCFGAVAVVENSILIGFCAGDESLSEEAIQQVCEKWLPRFMIPSEFVILSQFPRLPSGKADKKALLAHYHNAKAENNLGDDKIEAISPFQRQVLNCVSEVLNVQVQPETKLKHVGLDSLKAILLSSPLKGIGVNVQASDILSMERISDIWNSRAGHETSSSDNSTDVPSLLSHLDDIVSENPALMQMEQCIEDIHACTPLQLAMLSETARNPSLYWNDVEFEDDSGSSSEKIIEALEQVIGKNEILRTGYVPWKNGYVAIVFKAEDRGRTWSVLRKSFAIEDSTSEGAALLTPFRFDVESKPGEKGRLSFQLHHVIYDGWSMDLILSDVQRILRGDPLDDRLPFRRLIGLFSNHAKASESSDAEMFWKQHLMSWNKTTFPRLRGNEAAVDEILSTEMALSIAPSTVQSLTNETGCSAQVFFQAALAFVWAGVLGNSDVVLGSVTSGRTIGPSGIEGVIGPCMASLPLRINLGEYSQNADLLRYIHTSNRAMMKYSSFPLSSIQKMIGLHPGDTIYDVLFVYQESPYSPSKTNSQFLQCRHIDRSETKLLFEVTPTTDTYIVQATYHSNSTTTSMANSLMQQFSNAVTTMVSKHNESLGSLMRISKTPISVYNENPQTLQSTPDLASMVEEVVARSPCAQAICFSTLIADGGLQRTSLTFQELNDLSNQVAHLVRSLGTKTGAIVGIVMDKSPLLYASILGLVKAGCGYLPLLPTTPITRIQTIVDQAELSLCLTDDDSTDTLQDVTSINLVNIQRAHLETFSNSNLRIPADGSRIAYVIYTSGTTGTPKGVSCTQLNITSNVSYLRKLYPQSEGRQSRLLQACSQAFDVSVFEIFYTWCAGMCLCSGTNDTLFNDLELAIREMDITHLSLTPTVASLIDPTDVPSVEFLVTSGEPMTQAVYEKWDPMLWQGYGPSETTNICSVKPMGRHERIEHLGWTFPNTSVCVLPPGELEPLPMGWVGEFCFGGDQVAAGYLNMPELTATKFIQHSQFGRIYRSGDIGRMLPDGSLIILGRLDDQLKLRGQRIEAAEINTVITSTEHASSAVTLLVKRGNEAAEQLVLYYTPSVPDSPRPFPRINRETNQILFSALASRLPVYMIPSYLIPVLSIPRTSSGKVDRRSLLHHFSGLDRDQLESAAHNTVLEDEGEDWSILEQNIANVIKSWLKEDAILSRWTPFATLGIDSISAIGLARALSEKLERRVTISAILRAPSVAELSRLLETAMPRKSSCDSGIGMFSDELISHVKYDFDAKSHTVEEVLPSTPLQEAMLSGTSRGYYNKVLLRLRGGSSQMKGYWVEMTRRHAILRTCFISTTDIDHAIAQVVLRDWEVAWSHIQGEGVPLDDSIDGHLQMLPEPIDSGIPPVSLAIISRGGSEFLSFICHHALYDGVAVENLFGEIEALARGDTLPDPPSYKHFLNEALDLPQDYEGFWRKQLREYRPMTLFRKCHAQEAYQATYSMPIEMPLQKVQDKLKNLNISMLALCQGAWLNTLYVASDMPDICFGNVMSGRTADVDGIDNLVAPCFNTIPVREDLRNHAHGADLLQNLHRLNAKVLPYQHTPLRTIQRLVNRQGLGLFDTLLLLQQPEREMDSALWTLERDAGEMDLPLVCEITPCPRANTLALKVHYEVTTVGEEAASTFASVFESLLKGLLASPYAPLSSRSGLPPIFQERLERLPVQVGSHVGVDEDNYAGSDSETWSSEELKICKVLSKLSGVLAKHISRSRSIYQLGLDSINAVQIASQLRREGIDLMASDVIENPTCARLASHIASKEIARDPTDKAGTYNLHDFSSQVWDQVTEKLPGAHDIEAILPCTPMQSAMITMFLQSNQSNYYLNTMTFSMDPSVSIQQLTETWTVLQQHHPMLRTGFVPISHRASTFAMVRRKSVTSTLPVTDIDSHNHVVNLQERKSSLSRGFKEQMYMSPWHVDLESSPRGVKMSLHIHHALYDAQSLKCLLHGLSTQLTGMEIPRFGTVEDGLSEILHRAQDEAGSAAQFWEGFKSSTVVNSFPALTPLREEGASVRTCEMHSNMSFKDLEQAAAKASVSIQAIAQATWTRILSSYLGEESVVFGAVFSGRTSEAMRDAPLPCITTIPVIAANSASNATLMKEMMSFNAKLHKYQYAPLGQIQRWLGHPASPIFDTLLSYHGKPEKPSLGQPWTVTGDDATVEYPLSIEIEPQPGGLIKLCITHNTDVVPSDQAIMILRQFDAIMSHLALHPDGEENDLFRTQPELFAILPAELPVMEAPVQYLHQFVEMQAKLRPNKIALEFVDRLDVDAKMADYKRWSFRELDEMGNRVANMLADEAPANSIVAIHFEKSPEAYFAILGILKAGCSFVALDPTAPEARKAFILKDSDAPCLLTGDSGDSLQIGDSAIKVLQISSDNLFSWSSKARDIESSITPESTCYCLYTSGTTGTPKGCEITHDNAVQAMMAFQELFRGHWEDDSRWLQFAALHFDVSVLEQYWSWGVGMTVVSAVKDVILEDLTGFINTLDITHIDLTPSLARLTHPDEVPSLCRGVFITGGESLKQEILDVWGPRAVIYNAYGPTEATIGVTMYQRVPINGRPSNIGKQFPNVGSYVFHPGTEIPVLRGGVGELCVSGKLVGKGYLGRPDLTEDRFPTLHTYKDRVYRTGDLVRVLHDGCFDFLGRADDQVKLRGQRLEIGEINHTIRGVPEIHDVATVVAGSNDKSVLVSFLVSASATQGGKDLVILPDTEGLGAKAKAACRERLPGYMVPTYCLTLPFIPLSSNNKAEVKQLKQLFGELSHEQLMSLSPAASPSVSGAASETMQAILHTLSEFSAIPVDDMSPSISIFDVGVDSISALRLDRMLRARGLRSKPAVILRNPVVMDLAMALSSEKDETQLALVGEARQRVRAFEHRYRSFVTTELGVATDMIEYIAPCSPLQEGILAKSLTGDSRGSYFNTFVLDLSETVPVSNLISAWGELISSEPILRTIFLNTPEGFAQVALKHMQLPWFTCEVQSTDQLEQELKSKHSEWVAANSTQVQTPFCLLHVQGPDISRLVIYIFHALYDGNSFDILLHNLGLILKGRQVPLSPTFLDSLVHGPLTNHSYCKDYWLKYLKEWNQSPMPALVTDTSLGYTTAQATISADLVEDVRRVHGSTLQSVLLAAWAYVLRKYHPKGVSLGVIMSGRSIDLPGVERTNGPLFNTLPFFAKLDQNESWSALVRSCHDFCALTLSFPHVALQSIQKWCSRGRPLFDTLFTLQISQDEEDGDFKNNLWTLIDAPMQPDYPLALEITRSKDELLHMSLVAQRHIANETVLHELLQEFERVITISREEPDHVIQTISSTGSYTDMNGFGDSSPSRAEITERRGESQEAFHWTEIAITLREELATLANMTVDGITEATTTLALGLDSIDVIKLSAKLKQRGIKLSPARLMKLQNIVDMTASIEEQSEAREDATTNGEYQEAYEQIKTKLLGYTRANCVDNPDIETVLPPTPLQESMIAAMIESEFKAYFNHDVLEVQKGVDPNRLRLAFMQVIECNPILRTGFMPIEQQDLDMAYAQVVYKTSTQAVGTLRLDHLAQVDGVIEENIESARLGRGERDLLQLSLIEVEGRHLLVISIAHALYDGWSLDLMYQQIYRAYHGEKLMGVPSEPFLSRMTSSKTPQADKFWSDHLQDASPTTLPALRTAGDSNMSEVFKADKCSSEPLSDILSFCKSQSVSLLALCQACWALTLARLSKQLDVVFGMIMSGRDAEDTGDLMFPTINTVAARYILHGSSGSFVRQVESATRSMRQYQSYPLRKALMAAKRPGGGLFNSLFMLQKAAEDDGTPQLLTSIRGQSALDYPICAEAEAVGNDLIWRLACQPSHISARHAEEILSDLDSILSYLVHSPNSDLLSFNRDGVSICGMPATPLSPVEDSQQPKIKPLANGHDWDEPATTIREVLSEVSGVPTEQIGMHDTLFHLGLDSISAIKVASLLRKKSIRLGSRDLIVAEGIWQMAAMCRTPRTTLEQRPASEGWAAPPDIHIDDLLQKNGLDKERVEVMLPALPMQVDMVAAWQNANGAIFYPEFEYLLKNGCSITQKQIEDAWQLMVSSTPVLRTTLIPTTSRELPLLQVISKAADTAGSTASSAPQRLWSFRVGKDKSDEWVLRLGIHHALYDGVSLPAMMDRLAGIINSEQLRVSPDDISPWAEITTANTLAENRQRRRQFWTEYLRTCNGSAAMPKRETGTCCPVRPSHHVKRSAVADVASLRRVAASHGVGIQSLLLAAYAKVLAARDLMERGRGGDGGGGGGPRDGGGRDPHHDETTMVVFGIYLGNRSSGALDEAADVSPTFPRLNLVPLKVAVPASPGVGSSSSGGSGVVDIASAIQRDLGEISSHGRAEVGLWEIFEWTGLRMASFVNFISLPDVDVDMDADTGASREGDKARTRAVSLVPAEGVASAAEGSRDVSLMGDLVVRDAYLVSPYHHPNMTSHHATHYENGNGN